MNLFTNKNFNKSRFFEKFQGGWYFLWWYFLKVNNNINYSLRSMTVNLSLIQDLSFQSAKTTPQCNSMKNNQIVWLVRQWQFYFKQFKVLGKWNQTQRPRHPHDKFFERSFCAKRFGQINFRFISGTNAHFRGNDCLCWI